MKKIICVVGTRPQVIKHAALLPELQNYFQVISVNTNQHYDAALNDQLIADLYTDNPFINIALQKDVVAAERLGNMIVELAGVISTHNGDAVLVYGDTDSTLAGALAANKMHLPLLHVEAGERSYNLSMPEEVNRVITDWLATAFFCSSKNAYDNLSKEQKTDVWYTGDLMKDLLLKKASAFSTSPEISAYLFCTLHRNYNQTNPRQLISLFEALQQLSYKAILPLHPSTKRCLNLLNISLEKFDNIEIIEPLTYSQSIHYQKFAEAIITDSGGVQKEAYWLKKACITIRKETEWIETLEGGWNRLVYDDIFRLPSLLQQKPECSRYKNDLYGDGEAAKKIAHILNTII